RDGSRMRKRYDTPQTPYRRVLQAETIPNEVKDNLKAQYATLNPAQLKRDMIKLSEKLSKLSIKS
ncbi:MAG: transposase, partial [Dehalococcoidia bacterium]|nr:transposase [Dehalococcoidia bacterium]